MSKTKIEMTLHNLLDDIGLSLLNTPQRLDGFLRDIHPNQPREVFLIVEMIESGVLSKMRSGKPHLDAEFNGFAAQLSSKSGIAPTFARWAVQTWRDALPESAYDQEGMPEAMQDSQWSGSIDAVLGKRNPPPLETTS